MGVNRALTYILDRESQYLQRKCVEKTYEAFLVTIQSIIVPQWEKNITTTLWQLLKDKAWLLPLNCK